MISIHALREEGDDLHLPDCGFVHISIHALREEGDGHSALQDGGADRFLSTPSARRATNALVVGAVFYGISIHALREEGDRLVFDAIQREFQFLSTPSARRATSRPSP